MPAAILETVEATWNQKRTADQLRDWLSPRLADHALVDVEVEADGLDVDRLFDDVE